jgi:hypothetical protein
VDLHATLSDHGNEYVLFIRLMVMIWPWMIRANTSQ